MVLKMMKTGVFFCSNVEVIVDIVVNIGLDVVDANFYDVLHLYFVYGSSLQPRRLNYRDNETSP